MVNKDKLTAINVNILKSQVKALETLEIKGMDKVNKGNRSWALRYLLRTHPMLVKT